MSRFYGDFDPASTASTVTGGVSDTRTHSHVWNYSDVYEGQAADTWPDNTPLVTTVTSTGATTVEPGNGFKYFVFATSGTLAIPADSAGISVQYLIVAGGGGGGGDASSGGGAGGLRTNVPGNPLAGAAMTLPAASYSVVVGGGGAGGNFPGSPSPSKTPAPGSKIGTNGTASSFNSIVSAGGGSGAGHPVPAGGAAGGSGAGSNYTNGTAGSGNTPPVSPPQGNPGESRGSDGYGAGGGAGEAGGTDGDRQGGDGHSNPAFASPLIAPGIPSDAATAIGPTGLFAGGGGGSAEISGDGTRVGGDGGGGRGGDHGTSPGSNGPNTGVDGPGGQPGVDNTGGGGGGAANSPGSNPNMRPGGNGGKGVVILRLPTTQ